VGSEPGGVGRQTLVQHHNTLQAEAQYNQVRSAWQHESSQTFLQVLGCDMFHSLPHLGFPSAA
jgi:hypothetical protein